MLYKLRYPDHNWSQI